MFKVLTKGCEPTLGSKYSAAVDLYASEDVLIGAGETAMVGLGVCIDIGLLKKLLFRKLPPEMSSFPVEKQNEFFYEFLKSHYLQLNPRSSLRAKGLISNTGIIDLDYVGVENEIKIIIHNPILDIDENGVKFGTSSYYKETQSPQYEIKKGDRIAQILLKEHKSYLFGIKSNEKRSGGFGSTGESS